MTVTESADLPFEHVFAEALRGRECDLLGLDEGPVPLPIHEWRRQADAVDQAVLARCVGNTLDVGCGPGRMSAHLVEQGHSVLGIDIVPEAVRQARERGVAALQRSVFAPLPGEGRWDTVLLADGNIGIGGDPPALLARAAELVCPDGRVVVDLAPPGFGVRTRSLTIRTRAGTTRPFRWTVVAADAIGPLAAAVGLPVCLGLQVAGRWFAVLERR
jgi:SAM-dependent methyltransferase